MRWRASERVSSFRLEASAVDRAARRNRSRRFAQFRLTINSQAGFEAVQRGRFTRNLTYHAHVALVVRP